MFGLTPKSPVSEEAGAWVEASMRWFITLYGLERLQTASMVLPTEEFFPDDFHNTEESVQGTLRRLCEFLRVDFQRVVLEVFDDTEADLTKKMREALPHWEGASAGVAGTYSENAETSKFHIKVKRSLLADPVPLIGTLAHELCHVLLLGEKRIDREAPDMEPLTDLLTVFLGLGIFTANSAARFTQHDDGVKQGWSFQRLGYLSEPMFGYALAVFAIERGESKPAWAKYLSVNAGTYFRQSYRFVTHRRSQKMENLRG
jgi:hypothetical protein